MNKSFILKAGLGYLTIKQSSLLPLESPNITEDSADKNKVYSEQGTVCPRISDSFYKVTYYIKWVTSSWTDGISLFLSSL